MEHKWIIEFHPGGLHRWLVSASSGVASLEEAIDLAVDAEKFNHFTYRIRNLETGDVILASMLVKENKNARGEERE